MSHRVHVGGNNLLRRDYAQQQQQLSYPSLIIYPVSARLECLFPPMLPPKQTKAPSSYMSSHARSGFDRALEAKPPGNLDTGKHDAPPSVSAQGGASRHYRQTDRYHGRRTRQRSVRWCAWRRRIQKKQNRCRCAPQAPPQVLLATDACVIIRAATEGLVRETGQRANVMHAGTSDALRWRFTQPATHRAVGSTRCGNAPPAC